MPLFFLTYWSTIIQIKLFIYSLFIIFIPKYTIPPPKHKMIRVKSGSQNVNYALTKNIKCSRSRYQFYIVTKNKIGDNSIQVFTTSNFVQTTFFSHLDRYFGCTFGQFHNVSYYIKSVKTSWPYSLFMLEEELIHLHLPLNCLLFLT